jgi:hypothetical protein
MRGSRASRRIALREVTNRPWAVPMTSTRTLRAERHASARPRALSFRATGCAAGREAPENAPRAMILPRWRSSTTPDADSRSSMRPGYWCQPIVTRGLRCLTVMSLTVR